LPFAVDNLKINPSEQISQERRVPSTIPQPVVAPLTRAAMFLVVTVNAGPAAEAAVRGRAATWPGFCAP
jgi:putative iron-dependent peroxidase